MFLYAGSYIKEVLGDTGQVSTIKVDLIATMFKAHVLFHCIDMIKNAIATKPLFLYQATMSQAQLQCR